MIGRVVTHDDGRAEALPRSTAAARLTYAEWGERLARHFFRPEGAGAPIVMYVDDEVVADVAGVESEAAAVTSLSNAVRSKLRPDADNMFTDIRVEALWWFGKGMSGPPPFMAALAIASLAAARMATEGTMRSTNYYQRFRELLHLEGKGAPDGYAETFPQLWELLHSWLENDQEGRLGRSTIAWSETWTNIGFALSQTLMKRSDRERLSELFDAMGLLPGDVEVDGPELLTAYQSWAPRSTLSIAARHAAVRNGCEPQLQAILEAALRDWDGGLRDERGNRVATIHLAMELAPIGMALIADRPRGFPAAVTVMSEAGQRVTLQSSVDGWYDHLNWSVVDALTTGVAMRTDGLSFRFRPSDIIPMRQDTTGGRLGG